MTETFAFVVIAAALVAAPAAVWFAARRGGLVAGVAIGACFALLAVFLVSSFRPHLVAPLLRGTPLALLHPAWGLIPAVAGLLGLAERTDERNRRSVRLLCGILAGYTVWQAVPLLGDPAASLGGGGHWKDRCYIQSTNWSCAPSSSVSLLKTIGIDATEGEMARIMRARPRYGTNLLNIERGLASKVAGRGYRPELRRLDYEALVAAGGRGIASMYLELLLNHAVALVAVDAQGVTILDPLKGEERLTRAEFEARWLGDVVLLVPEAGS